MTDDIIISFYMNVHSYGETFISIRQAVAEKKKHSCSVQTGRQTKNHSECHLAKWHEVEWRSVERIPLPGWTVHILYPTDGLDLNQSLICLFTDMQMFFKFQVNRMKTDNFRNLPHVDVLAYVDLLADIDLKNNRWLKSVTRYEKAPQISS